MPAFSSLIRRAALITFTALAMSVFAHAAHAEAGAPADHGQKAQPAGVVNVNTASAEELERLPGIGPSRAQAILELRTKMKHFQSVDDLMRVKGIGRTSLRNLRPMITLDGPTTLAASAHGTRASKAAAPANAE